jgi:hypothetical protein
MIRRAEDQNAAVEDLVSTAERAPRPVLLPLRSILRLVG